MTWDAARGRPTRVIYDLDIFQALTTPYRAERAAKLGGWAAIAIALTNLASGARLYFEQIHARTWLGLSPTQAALCCIAMALGGLYLSVVIRKRHATWACILVLIWCGLESQHWLTYGLYGHVAIRFLPTFAAIYAIMGVRGSIALTRLATKTPQDVQLL
jgi:hypothetical protein